MWKDFKAFAFKGNVLDLAVGVVIGAAFALPLLRHPGQLTFYISL